MNTQPLAALAQGANLIVVGTARIAPGSIGTFSLTVARVINGSPNVTGTTLAVQWNSSGQGYAGVAVAEVGSGIWFLRSSPNGWSLLPVTQGAGLTFSYFPAPVSPILPAYTYSSVTSLQDKLASEISSAIENLQGSFNHELYGLFSGDLDQLNSPIIQVLYQRLSTSGSVQQQILGLSGLIRNGNVTALQSAISSAATLFSNNAMEYGILLSSVRDSFRSSDAAAITTLGQVATNSTYPNLPFREAAAHALASIHTASTLPYLAALLDDSQSTLQIEGVGGMGSFANGLPIQTTAGTASLAFSQVPAAAPYKTAETMANFARGNIAIAKNQVSYVSFWKGWWSQNHSGLGF